MRRFILLTAALVLLVGGATYVVPRAGHALALRLAADLPEQLADLRLAASFDAEVARREIAAALANDDIELVESFAELAEARGIVLSAEMQEQMASAQSLRQRLRRSAKRFGKGFATGEADGIEGIAGAATGDLFVYGDLRDLAREGVRGMRGEPIDRWMAALAVTGLAATATTYLSTGATSPARAGLSLFKAARRAGRISANLAADLGLLMSKGGSARAIRMFADVGRIEAKAGGRAAVEALRHTDNVAELSKVSRLAEKNGRGTLAVLKTLGRGALVLGAGALSGALWVMGAAANIFLLTLALCTVFANLARSLWRSGRLVSRGGKYVVTKLAAAA